MKNRHRGRIACQGFCEIADSVEDELARLNLYYYGFHTDDLGWKLHELQVKPKSDASDKTRNEALYSHNQSLQAQVDTLTQQVEDLQLHVSSTDTTSKKDVRFSDDNDPMQQLHAALPSKSASELHKLGQDLHKLGQDVWRELGKFLPSAPASSTVPQDEVPQRSPEIHESPKGVGNVSPRPVQRGSGSPSHDKTSSPARDKGPGAKAKVPGYLKGTAAAEAKRAATVSGPVTGGTRTRPETRTTTRPETRLMTRPETRTAARPATPKTSGKPAPGTREEVHTGDRRRFGHTILGDSPPSPSTLAAETPKKGKSTKGQDKEPVGSVRGGAKGGASGRGRGRGGKQGRG
jgi:hypothetical protein